MRREAIQQAVAVRADFRGGVVTPISFRHAARERAEEKDLRVKARPASHEVIEVGGKRAA